MTSVDSPTTPEGAETEELTPETVLALWSKTYNREGKPDWSHLFPHYHPDIFFHDSVQQIRGIEAFTAMCERLARRCKHLQMDIANVLQQDNVIMLEWKMTMTFRNTPSTPVYGCTRLTLHEDGRILEQRDYYDLWGDIFNGIPRLRGAYRRFMARLFG